MRKELFIESVMSLCVPRAWWEIQVLKASLRTQRSHTKVQINTHRRALRGGDMTPPPPSSSSCSNLNNNKNDVQELKRPIVWLHRITVTWPGLWLMSSHWYDIITVVWCQLTTSCPPGDVGDPGPLGLRGSQGDMGLMGMRGPKGEPGESTSGQYLQPVSKAALCVANI